jgi:hypothetical protein
MIATLIDNEMITVLVKDPTNTQMELAPSINTVNYNILQELMHSYINTLHVYE